MLTERIKFNSVLKNTFNFLKAAKKQSGSRNESKGDQAGSRFPYQQVSDTLEQSGAFPHYLAALSKGGPVTEEEGIQALYHATSGAQRTGISRDALKAALGHTTPEVASRVVQRLIDIGRAPSDTPKNKEQYDEIMDLVNRQGGAKFRMDTRIKDEAEADKKLKALSTPSTDWTTPALVAGGTIGLAKLVDYVHSKGTEWWDKRQKDNKKEESFDRIISTHPKFKNVSPEEITRLKALHSMIADYAPHMLDHDEAIAGTLFTAGQYQDFDPSLLKTLTEPEKNMYQSKSDKGSVFKDPAIEGMKTMRETFKDIQGANNG